MPILDYAKTVIYQLTCPTFDGVYINHTTSLRNKKYLYGHPEKATKHLEFYDVIDLHGGFDNWKMIVLEKYPDCKNAEDAKKKVEEWTKKLQPPPKTSNFPPKTSDLPPKTSDAMDSITCKNCGKKFTRNDNLQRHVKYRCIKQEIVMLREELAKKDEELAKKEEEHHKEIQTVREEMKKQMKKQKKKLSVCKYNSNNNSNNTINQNLQQNNINNINNIHNNTTINNHNITIELGKEKLSEFFTHKQQKQILDKGYNSLDELILLVHFNPNYKQFQNISITNMHGPFGYKYVEDAKDFIIVRKKDLSKEVVECRMYDIEDFLENCKGIMLEKKIKTISDFIEKMEDEEYAEKKKKKISIDIYNSSNDVDMKEVMKKVKNAKHPQNELLPDTDISSPEEIENK